jgi:glyoxylase-like metal-dependent hydrolase (beta-lactamase superfamily II)
MYELIQAAEHCYYLQSPAKIGIYESKPGHVLLIDSGNDKDAGRKVRQILEQKSWQLDAIVNTHSNADHIGGNKYLQAQTGCKVFANGIENAFTRFPLLESAFLYGGFPCAELRHKFLMAQESDALGFDQPDFPKTLEVIPLPGHFFDMVGFRTPDDVVFLADCLSSEATLDKYGVPFIFDVQAYLNTLDKVAGMSARLFVPAHADAAESIAPLCRLNQARVLAIADHVLSLCSAPSDFDTILRSVFKQYGLEMSMEQYVLVGSTIRSFLSWLKDSGRLIFTFENCQLLWSRT